MTVHRIVTGHVTRRQDVPPFRVTARKIVKRTLITCAVIFILFLAFGLTLNALAGNLIPR